MSAYLFIPLLEVAFGVALMALLRVGGQRHIARKPFALFLFFMTLWGLFIYLMRSSSSLRDALFWEKFVLCAILSAALFFYRFTMSLTGAGAKRHVQIPLHMAYFLFLALVPTGLVVEAMQTMWYGKAPVIGPLFFPYVIAVYAPLVLGLRVLLKHLKRTRINDERTRGQYIVAGIGAMFIGGTTDYLPSLGVIMYPLGIIGNIFFCVLATVAMLRHNLLDARVVLRKGTAYSLVSMLILGVFGSLIFGLSTVFRQLMSPISLTITIIAVFTTAAVSQPVLSRMQRMVDRWFFRKRYDHIQALKRFTRQRKGDLDLRQLSSSLTAAVVNAMGSRGAYLLLPGPATGDLESYAYCGQKSVGRMSFAASSPLVVTMKYQDGPVDSGDIDIIPSLSGLAYSDRELLMRNEIELMLPLKSGGGLVGILLLGRKTSGEPYSNEDRELLRTVSESVAVTIENAGQYESLKKERGELRKAVEGVIHAVSLVVEIRDPYTAGHQKRVAELARAIAREMGLSEWQTTGVYIAGLLHDVGKVAVPTEILSKPGKLNEYEFRLIKDHPRVGCGILERIEFPWPVTKVVLQHHERLDGSGYPDGICGGEISQGARILAVADVVEAISSHRPYRPALGLGSALDEITHQSGILYDSDAVEACLRLFKDTGVDLDGLVAVAAAREGAAITI